MPPLARHRTANLASSTARVRAHRGASYAAGTTASTGTWTSSGFWIQAACFVEPEERRDGAYIPVDRVIRALDGEGLKNREPACILPTLVRGIALRAIRRGWRRAQSENVGPLFD